MDKKPKYEFNQQSATQNLRRQEVIFSINNPRLDDLFNREFGPIADYVEKDGEIYYYMSPQDYDRFIDFAISSGYDIDRYVNQVEDINEEGSVTGGGEAYLPAMNVPSKKQNPFKEDVLSGYKKNKGFRPGHTQDKGGFQYKDLWGMNENENSKDSITDIIKKHINTYQVSDDPYEVAQELGKKYNWSQDQIEKAESILKKDYLKEIYANKKYDTLNEMQHILNEIFTKEDYAKIIKILDKIKYTNTTLYNQILDMLTDINPHSYNEIPQSELNENYHKFKNETSKRTKPEQFHQAVKSVKRRVEEISKLYEYMERLKMELSESEDGLRYKKYTENAMAKIKESVKQLHLKTKKLK